MAVRESDREREERGEVLRVYLWRRAELIRAGYEVMEAAAIAYRTDIDLHRACQLVRAGCPSRVACDILL